MAKTNVDKLMAFVGKSRKIIIIVENLPCPFDRRVWQEATTLQKQGYEVSVICPVGKGCEKRYEVLDGIYVYRHPLPLEADGAVGYLLEYSVALFWEFVLVWRIYITRGFDVIHACNPPDLIFLIGMFFKLFGKKFVFDHHDINPELYEAKFGHRGIFYQLMLIFERLTFYTADISIATNNSYKEIAIARGKMNPDKVFVVRSGPNLDRLKVVPGNESIKRGRKHFVGYVGVMGKQEGIDYLLRAVRFITKKLKRDDIHFGLVGSGTEIGKLKQYANELGLSDFVTFFGRVSDEELLEVLNTADVCVNPDVFNSMNDKSTMNKIMEYMALGKPIVQFDLTEGRVSAQQASLYADVNNDVDLAMKIIQLIDNPDLRKEMGEIGRMRIVNDLEWNHEVPNLVAAYSALWNKSKFIGQYN